MKEIHVRSTYKIWNDCCCFAMQFRNTRIPTKIVALCQITPHLTCNLVDIIAGVSPFFADACCFRTPEKNVRTKKSWASLPLLFNSFMEESGIVFCEIRTFEHFAAFAENNRSNLSVSLYKLLTWRMERYEICRHRDYHYVDNFFIMEMWKKNILSKAKFHVLSWNAKHNYSLRSIFLRDYTNCIFRNTV